jgi:predicted GIY-YIG superfamily endonuclease
VKVAFTEEFASRTDALERELQIKRWSHRKKVALIRREWATLSRLAKGYPKTR